MERYLRIKLNFKVMLIGLNIINLGGKAEQRTLKSEVIAHYGGKCVCCEEDMVDFLTIDHISNNGAELRRTLKCGSGNPFHQWLKKNDYPKDYQVLCFNCNVSKHINKGICVHKLGKVAREVMGQVANLKPR